MEQLASGAPYRPKSANHYDRGRGYAIGGRADRPPIVLPNFANRRELRMAELGGELPRGTQQVPWRN